jgi:hypothetical protein
LAFKDVDMADHFLNELRGLEKEHILELEDACVVVRDGDGKIHLKQSVNLVAVGATRGASFGMLMGTLVGVLFMNPLAGLLGGGLYGAWSGALKGRLMDYGSSSLSGARSNPAVLLCFFWSAKPSRIRLCRGCRSTRRKSSRPLSATSKRKD